MSANREHICTPNCFRVWRDGRYLPTRECNQKLRKEYTREAERLSQRRAMWLGPKEGKR